MFTAMKEAIVNRDGDVLLFFFKAIFLFF
ncbi:BnaA09g05030D [Brassica napus]|uniref:BnaA09g05030D protein n=1 Tax=Brassica napus TaxID=3708 RepID=A0A078FZV4_BRANA|nr:BnaA09g05030D [Brassica napus]